MTDAKIRRELEKLALGLLKVDCRLLALQHFIVEKVLRTDHPEHKEAVFKELTRHGALFAEALLAHREGVEYLAKLPPGRKDRSAKPRKRTK